MITYLFDVGHGFCAYARDDLGNNLLFDCGDNEITGFIPTDYILGQYGPIDRFFVLNYDEDHISGLPRLIQTAGQLPVRVLHRNVSLTAEQLAKIKLQCGPLSRAMKELIALIGRYAGGPAGPAAPPGMDFEVYCNDYPAFDDTNNLSVVVFVNYPGFTIAFPGDLEKAGWRALLPNLGFQAALRRTRIFVASHHGRESGYEPAVFKFCTPDVVLISDEPMQYDTQTNCYAEHASGIPWGDGSTRRVLTTRCDGHITISNNVPNWLYWISTQK